MISLGQGRIRRDQERAVSTYVPGPEKSSLFLHVLSKAKIVDAEMFKG